MTAVRTQLTAAAGIAKTLQSPQIADALLVSAQEGRVFRDPAQDLLFAAPFLDVATPDTVLAALRGSFKGVGPILFRSAQSESVGQQALTSQVASAYAAPLRQRVGAIAVDWPYTNFGKPSSIVSRAEDEVLGTTTVRFGNGTTLVLKRTPFEKDRVHVAVNLGQGRAGISPELSGAMWAAPFMVTGGTGKFSLPQILQWAQTSGKQVNISLILQLYSLMLIGTTRPDDLLAQTQLLAAYARDPGFRPEAAQQLAAVKKTLGDQMRANQSTMAQLGAELAVNGTDHRFMTITSPEDAAATSPEQLSALMKAALAGPADVVMVGDISVEQGIAAVQSTFAAGLALPILPAPSLSFPPAAAPAQPLLFSHGGRPDQATYTMIWRIPPYWDDPQTNHVADVATAILSGRLQNEVRKNLGLTYSPSARALLSLLPRPGVLMTSIETPEANFSAFRRIMDDLVAELARRPITQDELRRAVQPLIYARRKERETNDFCLAQLSFMTRSPRIHQLILDRVTGIESVTAFDVQKFFSSNLVLSAPTIVITRASSGVAPRQSETGG